MSDDQRFKNHAAFIWSVADRLSWTVWAGASLGRATLAVWVQAGSDVQHPPVPL